MTPENKKVQKTPRTPSHPRRQSTRNRSTAPKKTSRKQYPSKGHRNQRPGQKRRSPSPGSRPHRGKSKKKSEPIPPIGENIRIIPLGGAEEIGKNMYVIQYKEDIIIVDAGFQFSTHETPGIDFILPNTAYLEERKHMIRGLFITHGHLDHIGGIPYLIEKLGFPTIYSREFGALMIKKRQEDFKHMKDLDIRLVGGDDTISVSKNLKVRTFAVTHAIPDSIGLIIETPIGDIVFIEDVRVDHIDGKPTKEEEKNYEIFKNRKVLLLTMDSTNVEKRGFSISETTALENIESVVRDAKGRLIVGTFASQVDRIIAIMKMAEKYGKYVVIEGRSMKSNVEIIKQLGLLSKTKNIIPIEDIDNYPTQKIVVLATGAQGEEFAVLMRIANKTHKNIKLNKNDTVLLSSSIIPGNEGSITKLKDNLYRQEANIITYLDMDVHASGHGNRDELGWIHNQIDYKYFMPLHGHHFMLRQHAELAHSLGTPKENIIVPDNGSIVEIQDNGKKIEVLKQKVVSELIMVDGFSIGDVQDVVLRDRQMLADDGIFIVVVTIHARTGKLRKSPDIISRGFVYLRESQELMQQTRLIIKKVVEQTTAEMYPINFDYLKDNVTDNVRKFLLQKTAKKPMVIPVILAV